MKIELSPLTVMILSEQAGRPHNILRERCECGERSTRHCSICEVDRCERHLYEINGNKDVCGECVEQIVAEDYFESVYGKAGRA